jgi:hypothetical protein
MTRGAAVSLDEAAGASFGRGSVLLHPPAQRAPANIVTETTAASRRDHEYGCMLKGAKGAKGAGRW